MRSKIANWAELFHLSKDDRLFGLIPGPNTVIRYKSDDFSENSLSNSEICAVMSLLVSPIIWNSREYFLHEQSELVNLDKSWS